MFCLLLQTFNSTYASVANDINMVVCFESAQHMDKECSKMLR